MLFPIGELVCQHLSRQPCSLPRGEVCVLQWQLFQWRGLAIDESFVESCDFANEDSQRPTIHHNVVHSQEGYMFPLFKAQQLYS